MAQEGKGDERMSRLAFRWVDPDGKGLETWSLHKAPKGHFKGDTIRVDFLKVGGVWDKSMIMTPDEAIIIATGLLFAALHKLKFIKKVKRKKRK